MSPRSADIGDAALRIEAWLLDSAVQLPGGPHRGGVAGWLDADGRPEFVYLEITGYYLTTLAWLAGGAADSQDRADQALDRGRAALDWMRAACADGAVPPTRLYLSPGQDDWRNRAVFSFDLAMAVRGAACFAAVDQAADATSVVRDLVARLNEVSPGAAPLASHALANSAGGDLPERWSTRPGPHHIKAAAAILGLPPAVPEPGLIAACRTTVAHWADALTTSWPCSELHPLLYGLEGLLMLESTPRERMLDLAEPIYGRLLALQAADGSLPDTLEGSGGVRADVLAQALRAGELLRAAGRLRGHEWGGRLDGLAAALLAHVRPDGGVLFSLDQHVSNTWCAMFAHQALTLHARAGDAMPAGRAAALLV